MKFHTGLSPRARAIFALIESATAPDPLTVRIVLKRALQPFLLMFDASACAIVPAHLLGGQDYRTASVVQRAVGTGPFRFAEWQRGNFVRLERLADYRKPGQPYRDQIIYRVAPDSQSRRLAIETGQAQLTQANDIEPFDVPALRAKPNLEVSVKASEYFSPVSWIELNHRVKPLDDVRVRQAIGMAVGRYFIAQRQWFGIGKPATNPVASTTRFHDASVKVAGYDVRAANALLDAAGHRANTRSRRRGSWASRWSSRAPMRGAGRGGSVPGSISIYTRINPLLRLGLCREPARGDGDHCDPDVCGKEVGRAVIHDVEPPMAAEPSKQARDDPADPARQEAPLKPLSPTRSPWKPRAASRGSIVRVPVRSSAFAAAA